MDAGKAGAGYDTTASGGGDEASSAAFHSSVDVGAEVEGGEDEGEGAEEVEDDRCGAGARVPSFPALVFVSSRPRPGAVVLQENGEELNAGKAGKRASCQNLELQNLQK